MLLINGGIACDRDVDLSSGFGVTSGYGLATGGLNLKRIAIFLLTWLRWTYRFAACLQESVRAMFSSFEAVLDLGLVFIIFGRRPAAPRRHTADMSAATASLRQSPGVPAALRPRV
jgi:hypothetical protein